jgi:putative endonuclease
MVGERSSPGSTEYMGGNMHYAYILESVDGGRRYIGSTGDLRRRLEEHNSGGCAASAKYGPWKVKCYFAFENEEVARRFERYLKSGSGQSFRRRHFECLNFRNKEGKQGEQG